MASVSAIRDGLKTRLKTIAGLRVSDTVPGQVNPPAAVIAPDSISFDSTMARGSDDFVFIVYLIVGTAVDRIGQDKLDGYLAGSGASSVKAAIEADESLGGVANFARVSGVRQYGLIEYAGVQYIGAEFVVEVNASGS
ncbi:MAG TPA: hypothetical protein VF174_13760 [Micromonosporaceae bacterium]